MVDEEEAGMVMMMKGKRSKRGRALSSVTLQGCSEDDTRETYSDESCSNDDEDMAHCLILLAQGSSTQQQCSPTITTKANPNKNQAYECKTCNKSFPSFQALGGHRASHKKPKLGMVGAGPLQHSHTIFKSPIYSVISDHNQLYHQYNQDEVALSLRIATSTATASNNKGKVHECSICGAEFSSGQALGGHMRRHRPIGGTNNTIPTSSHSRGKQETKTRNFMSLDLNLPAPEDDHRHQQQHLDNSSFVFPLNGKTLVFSASSLVDCHL